ncbi:hypothetical protein [Amycolatopsis sp. NPDC051102]|uniref:hypothetical protein n=1 Tax=Amycolatopsis sp. NPDC051102 TaxID=3155163 RepID=UPI00341285D9
MAGGHVVGLIEKIITSTPNCVRVVVSIALLVGVAVAALWWLNAEVRIGSFDLTRRDETSAKVVQQCKPNNNSPDELRACGG